MPAEDASIITSLSSRRSKLSATKLGLLEEWLGDTAKISAQMDAIPSRTKQDSIPLSFAQQGLWLIDQIDPGNAAYNYCFAVRMEGVLNLQALERAINEVIRRHEALRTRIEIEEGGPVQVIDEWKDLELDVVDLTGLVKEKREEEIGRIAKEEAKTGFDLRQGPLMRVKVLRLGKNERLMLLTMHHIITDGWSMGVLYRELGILYRAFAAGLPSPLPELSIQYADYACWQRQWMSGEALESQLGYWKRQLAGELPALELPTDRPRPAVQRFNGALRSQALEPELSRGLKVMSRERGVTLFTTLLVAFKTLLHRYTGQTDIVVGTPVANRTRAETEDLIGFFVNTLVLRTDLSGNPSFGELLSRVRETALEAYAHQDLPFDKLVEELQPERDLSRAPLFQVMFELQNMSAPELSGLNSSLEVIDPGAAKFDLDFLVIETAQGLGTWIEYNTDLFDEGTIDRMFGHYRRLLEGAVADPEGRLSDLPLLTETEQRQLLLEWNETGRDYPHDQCLHQLFEIQVGRAPDAIAVVFGQEQLTYRELNWRANQLANLLQRFGVGPEALVALLADRGIDFLITMLAIFKVGGAYIPLDPRHPAQRIGQTIGLSGAGLVVSASQFRALAADAVANLTTQNHPPVFFLEELLRGRHQEENLGRQFFSGQLAYVIFTSGSTGVPKGAMVEQRGMLNHLYAKIQDLPLDDRDVVAQTASQCFDISVWQFLAALLVGGQVQIFDDEITHDPACLLDKIEQRKITVLEIVPSMMRAVLTEIDHRRVKPNLSTLRWLILTGEALPPDLCREWFHLYPEIPLLNAYGPTECSDDVTHCLINENNSDNVLRTPIGRPIANTQIYILDTGFAPQPIGIGGELYIGGVGVGRGYLNEAGKTAEYFLPAPFGMEAGARVYRSGDLARYLPDSRLEYFGRVDHQVKIHGFRIELGEIEAALRAHPSIEETVVVAKEGMPGKKSLVVYLVPRADTELSIGELRDFLKQKLPEYMVPAAYVQLESLPLTPNGKLDRKALPAPEADAYATQGYAAPEGEVERALAEIWAEALNVERIGRHDNFFELGGHSLLAVTLIERMRRKGLQADVRTLFTSPTPAALAVAVKSETSTTQVPPNRIPPGCEAITPEMLPLAELSAEEIESIVRGVPGGAANVQDIYPLATLQEGILFHHLMETEGDPYLISGMYSFDSRARLDNYVSALQAVVDRHDNLRTAVVWEGLSEPMQVVWRKAALPVVQVMLDPAGGDLAEQLYTRFDPRHTRIEVYQAPLMHLYIAQDEAKGRWLLLLLSHHLIGDHTSREVVKAEIQAHLLGEADQLVAPQPFRNFVAQARTGVSREEYEGFFRQMLGEVEEPTAPFGLLDARGDGSGIEEARLELEEGLARRLRSNARRLGVSAASVFHLAWAQVLARASGREDVVFGTVLFGRMQGGEGADRVMGLFINTLPVRIQVGAEGVEESVRRTHRLLADLMRHEHASLALAQRCSGVPAPTPLFSALLNYRHSAGVVQARSAEEEKAWEGIEALYVEERTNYPLILSVDDLGEGFVLEAQVEASIGPRRVCEFMQKALERLVEALEREPAKAVSSLDVLPEWEQWQVVEGWNKTEAEFPSERCIHELFEEQAQRTPQAVAVVYQEQELTYQELNERANRLAHLLMAEGIGPEDVVALALPRSLEMIVALLGILKAGAAYLPLDADYPRQRLSYMLQDAGVTLLLTEEQFAGHLPEHNAAVIYLDTDWELIAQASNSNPPAQVSPTNLVYVIYTSGSTGNPKGAMLTHRSIVNCICWMQETYRLDATDRFLMKTSLNFDPSVWELFWPLLIGGAVVLAEPQRHQDPAYLSRLIDVCEVTSAYFVPSMLRAFLHEPDLGACRSLRRVICGGESLSIEAVNHFFERFDAEFHHSYGPTETSIAATEWTCRRESKHLIAPIGKPLGNIQVYILDAAMQPAPIGSPGELYIGGICVGRGYLNRPDLTAERFVPDPFGNDPGGRFYRTGDLARYLSGGDIEFCGRVDNQVKLRGHRIELGEIEAALRSFPKVRETVVVARESERGEKRLVGYVVGAEDIHAGELREYLRGMLPEYMAPGVYVVLEELPLTPSGKIDRRALPVPEGRRPELEQGYVAARTSTEQILTEIWSHALGLPEVGIHDNFFDLGGHSLLLVEVLSRLRGKFKREVHIVDLFKYPTIELLATYLAPAEGEVQLQMMQTELAAKMQEGQVRRKHRLKKFLVSRQ